MTRLPFFLCVAAGLALASPPRGDVSSTPSAFADDGPADIWKASCAMCHGKDGSARTWLGKRNKVRDLTDQSWKAKASQTEIRQAIELGVADTKMKAFGTKMSATQLKALTAFVRTLGETEVAER